MEKQMKMAHGASVPEEGYLPYSPVKIDGFTIQRKPSVLARFLMAFSPWLWRALESHIDALVTTRIVRFHEAMLARGQIKPIPQKSSQS